MARRKVDLYVGNTDRDWFDYLKSQTNLREVNYWQPSGVKFKALSEGGIFFFRLKSPINKIGGFGLLASTENASIELLWESLGAANGVRSKEEFISRVKHYRSKNKVKGFVDEHTQVGFKILVEPTFLDEHQWFDQPRDWSPQIVVGKGYSSDSEEGALLGAKYLEHSSMTSARNSVARTLIGLEDTPQAEYSSSEVLRRTGQQIFKLNLLSAYGGKCAITDCEVEQILDAAHITPFSETQNHSIKNGILLRRDVHALFDNGFLFIDDEYKVRFASQFKERHGPNLSGYASIEGKRINLPDALDHWPDKSALQLHQKP